MTIIEQVKSKIAELQNIMSHKGEGGENENLNIITSNTNSNVNDHIKSKGGGNIQMNPITRDGMPVVDGKLTSPEAIMAMSGSPNVPATDFLALVKANDPYNESAGSAVITAKDKESAPETNKIINDELKGMPSTTEHADAEKAVEKAVSTKQASDEIADVVARVKRLKQATEEIGEIINEKPVVKREDILARIRARIQQKAKVEGLPTDPVKGGEDAGKTPEDSVKSIKTTKAEAEMRPVEQVGEGKNRYSPDKDTRDQEAKDALSKGKKDEGVRAKEPNLERPATHKKAGIAGKLASLEVFAEDSSDILKEKHVKYPVEKSPDMDFEGAASRTEKEINKEHSEREKDKGDKSPLKTTLWSQRGRRVSAARPAFQEMTEAQQAKVKEMAASLKSKEASGEIESAYAIAVSKVQDMIEGEGRVKASCDKGHIKNQIQAYKEALKDIKGEGAEDIRQLEVLESNVAQLEQDMEKLSYVPMSTKPTKDMSWEEIISEGNAVYADLMRILGEVSDVASPFIEDAEKSVKAASLKFAAEEDKGEEKEEKGEDKGEEKEEKDEKDDDSSPFEKKDKDEKGKKSKKGDEKSVAKETITLLKDIRDTAEEMNEEITEHLENVEKKTGIPVPEARPEMGLEKLPGEGIPGMGGIREEGFPGIEGIPGEELPPLPESGAPALRCGWIGVMPKTAQEEEQIVEEIKKDATLLPEQKWNEIKKIRKTQGWKAVFTKIGSVEEAADAAKSATEEAGRRWEKLSPEEKAKSEKEKSEHPIKTSVDKQNSYWSVYRGNELVIRATVADLYKTKAVEAFDWASSKGYGEKLLTAVLNDGFVATAEKLGIQSMIKVSAKGKDKIDPKAYYRKIYPASYVSELFKEHKKKADLEIGKLMTKLGEIEQENIALKKANEQLLENQKLHAKAEKALSLVKMSVEKGLIEQKDFDSVVDGIMLMNDEGFDTFSKTLMKAPSVRKATIDEKIEMVKSASKANNNTDLRTPIQIQASSSAPSEILKEKLSGLWIKSAKN